MFSLFPEPFRTAIINALRICSYYDNHCKKYRNTTSNKEEQLKHCYRLLFIAVPVGFGDRCIIPYL